MFKKKIQGTNIVQIKCLLYCWKALERKISKMVLHVGFELQVEKYDKKKIWRSIFFNNPLTLPPSREKDSFSPSLRRKGFLKYCLVIASTLMSHLISYSYLMFAMGASPIFFHFETLQFQFLHILSNSKTFGPSSKPSPISCNTSGYPLIVSTN
jgi:hypothetical protein